MNCPTFDPPIFHSRKVHDKISNVRHQVGELFARVMDETSFVRQVLGSTLALKKGNQKVTEIRWNWSPQEIFMVSNSSSNKSLFKANVNIYPKSILNKSSNVFISLSSSRNFNLLFLTKLVVQSIFIPIKHRNEQSSLWLKSEWFKSTSRGIKEQGQITQSNDAWEGHVKSFLVGINFLSFSLLWRSKNGKF